MINSCIAYCYIHQLLLHKIFVEIAQGDRSEDWRRLGEIKMTRENFKYCGREHTPSRSETWKHLTSVIRWWGYHFFSLKKQTLSISACPVYKLLHLAQLTDSWSGKLATMFYPIFGIHQNFWSKRLSSHLRQRLGKSVHWTKRTPRQKQHGNSIVSLLP